MSTRERILEVTAALLAESPNCDVSTRAVCEAAQVGAPALYRNFGDKEGLLSAVVDHGFDKYLAAKRRYGTGADPIEDLRNGWDSHVDFALRNPNRYRLMNSPAMRTPPGAAQGKLRLAPELAAQVVMSANVGVALMLVSRPVTFPDRDMSRRVRDAVHAAVFIPDATGPRPSDDATGTADGTEVASTAARLSTLLRRSRGSALSTAEAALMTEWLDRLSNAS
ncbi:TetR/AcrR family transcriptional regulator [Streptomyces scopuliridis]|uniref:TetR/AcrR family transcriptional regulator n=1 Tax=Streptomyces scopuliridis TaxID=452529 RepID=UPI0036C4AD18